MNKKFYVFFILGLVLLSYSLLLSNRFIDSYNHKKQVERTYNEVKNYILTETVSDSIHLPLETELFSFSNDTCQLKDVIHPDTMYLILTISMRYWATWTFDLIKKLEVEKGKIPCVQIRIITYGNSLRDMKVKMNSFKDIFPIHMTSLDNVGLPISKSDNPCIIFTNDGKTAVHALTFEHNSTRYLDEFIQILFEKYCESTINSEEK